jgi:CHAD domain-containing protein
MYLETSHSDKRVTLVRVSKKLILKLARIRLKKCVSIAPRLLVDDDPKDIHDLRVSSRRLQQLIGLLFPKRRPGKSRKVLRSLRTVRRDWSVCRNLDVNLDLLREKLESVQTDVNRDAWYHVRKYISDLRAQEFAAASKRLRRLDLLGLIDKTQRLLKAVQGENAQELTLVDSFANTLARWYQALAQAKGSKDPEQLHELRISGKRLRYRFEVFAELGDGAAKSHVKSLKALQDELGRWHDRHVLLKFVKELNKKPDFLGGEPEIKQVLETDIENDRQNNDSAIDEILAAAESLQFELDRCKPAPEPDYDLTASS